MERSNCADPMTPCGLRESQVNAIMEANIAAWLVRRGLPKEGPKRPRWPFPPMSEQTREKHRVAARAVWARRKRGRAA